MSGRGTMTWCEGGIPSELRGAPRWVCWRYAERDTGFTKIPICARTGGAASSTAPTTWTDYATAVRCARTHACGIGIMMGDGIAGVDLDDCLSDAGELAPWAREIVTQLDSYTEVSPSGRGVHVLVRGALPGGRRRHRKIEMYDRDRYLCVTGRRVTGTPRTIEERTVALAALHSRVFRNVEMSAARLAPRRTMLCSSDVEIIARARRARNGDRFRRLWRGDAGGYASASEADLALCSMLAWYTDDAEQIARLVSQSGLARDKWGRADYRARTIDTALAGSRAPRGASDARYEAAVMRGLTCTQMQ